MIKNIRAYNVDKLIRDRKFVEERFKYEDGGHGHKISLPSIDGISESHKDWYENEPYREVLGYTPYFKEIFDSFETEIAGFMLQERKPYSSYGLHEDRGLGKKVKRFQIPIITNGDVWLCITDHHVIPEDIRLLYEKDGLNDGSNLWTHEVFEDKNKQAFRNFKERFDGYYKCYKLPPGIMYHFDVTNIHTLFNGGSTSKVSLLIDLKVNDWLENWIENEFLPF
jgi:hypothetical protein